jgi:hypothetical protein
MSITRGLAAIPVALIVYSQRVIDTRRSNSANERVPPQFTAKESQAPASEMTSSVLGACVDEKHHIRPRDNRDNRSDLSDI